MPRHAALGPSTFVACSIAVLFCSVVAHAQNVEGYDPSANQIVNAVAVQPNGKVIVGGGFTGFGSAPVTVRNRIARLNVDGSVDPTFNPGTNGPVLAVAVQPDGKILAGGNFTFVGGATGLTTARSHIARFNPDGSVDLSFNPGANLNVHVLVVQPDGKILVGGDFSVLGGLGRIGLGRLNANGSPDTFNPGASKLPLGAVPIVRAMALQTDGKVVVGGYFNGLGGGTGNTTRNYIGRVNADGTLDPAFNPGANSINGVDALVIQPNDGMIVVGGTFTGLGAGTGGTPRANIGRIDINGQVDLAFNPGTETQVLTLGLQTDGKILAGGYFKWMGDAGGPLKSTRNYIGRLNGNGAVDGTFNPGASNVVNGVALQADGRIVVVGIFDKLGAGGGVGIGTPRSSIGRLSNTDAAVQTLTLSGGNSVLTWARSGASPEVSGVVFESSTTGAVYSPLGTPTRVTGGWQLSGLSLPAHHKVFLRARGFYGTGMQSGSGSLVESIVTSGTGSSTNRDFDGDGKADIAVFRPTGGTWYIFNSGTSTLTASQWGINTDVPVPADYDGDGKLDIAVYRPSSGTWFLLESTLGYVSMSWGAPGDVPVPGDYDGDGLADVAVFRPSTGEWFIRKSATTAAYIVAWGISTDVPVPADYDGDGRVDIGVYRPSTGTWYVLRSSDLGVSITAWGGVGDRPAVGDYDGDGIADPSIYRPSTGEWFIRKSNSSTLYAVTWGISTDVPVPTDYDGDGVTDIAVFRPSSGTWYILQSSDLSVKITQWGVGTDVPLHQRP